jgi:hypothetical protein
MLWCGLSRSARDATAGGACPPESERGIAAINNELLLQWIRACIEDGRYYFTDQALTEHTVVERFTPRQAIAAIARGTIISRRDDASRCLICGESPELDPDPTYITTYIHCVVQWNELERVVIITMYRPKSTEWKNQFTRR